MRIDAVITNILECNGGDNVSVVMNMVVIINIQITEVEILITTGDIRGPDGGLTMVDGEIKYIEHPALVEQTGNIVQTMVVYVILDKEVEIIL